MLWLVTLVPAFGALVPVTFGRRWRRGTLAAAAAGVVGLTLVLAGLAVAGQWTGALTWHGPLALTARLDRVSATLLVLVPAVALPVVVFAAWHESTRGIARLMTLLIAFVGAMELLVMADDFVTLIVGWELVGACSWGLICHEWHADEPPRDAAAAFITTRMGDLGLFVAAMVTFAGTGSFGFDALHGLPDAPMGIAAAGILVAAAAKSAQVPFAFWLFNAMSGPSSASALLHAATMVAAGAYLLIRLHPALEPVAWFSPAAVSIGLVTALAGGLVAILQPHAKKLLAASTSAHYGLMFTAIGAGYPAVGLVHLVMHAWFKAPLFLAAGVVTRARHTHLLALLAGERRLPILAALAAVATAALAGLPPLGAAWSKELVGAAAGHYGHWLTVGVLMAGAASAVYAARWQMQALGPQEFTGTGTSHEHPWPLLAIGAASVVTMLTSLLWLPPLHDAVGAWLGTSLPAPPPWERGAALCLLAVGLYVGCWLALDRPHLGRRTRSASAADWLGLPRLAGRCVADPVRRLAELAARFDDAVIDQPATGLAAIASAFGRGLGRADDQVLDRTVGMLARSGLRAATLGRSVAEAIVEGAVNGTARIVLAAGADTTRLESGLAHHYLSWVAVGAIAFVVIVLMV